MTTLRAPAILTGRHEFFRGGRGSARVSRNFVAKAMRRSLDPVFSYFFASRQLGWVRLQLHTSVYLQRGS
jgi:hypothetical protein